MFTVADAKRYLKWTLVTIVAIAALIYLSDYLWFRVREARDVAGGPFANVTVYYQTTLKNGKQELFYTNPTNLPCVDSLFPHEGFAPCWYLRRSPVQDIQ